MKSQYDQDITQSMNRNAFGPAADPFRPGDPAYGMMNAGFGGGDGSKPLPPLPYGGGAPSPNQHGNPGAAGMAPPNPLGYLAPNGSPGGQGGSNPFGFMSPLLNILGPVFGGFRAQGGPMRAGNLYVLNEHGPETVVDHKTGKKTKVKGGPKAVVPEHDSTVIPAKPTYNPESGQWDVPPPSLMPPGGVGRPEVAGAPQGLGAQPGLPPLNPQMPSGGVGRPEVPGATPGLGMGQGPITPPPSLSALDKARQNAEEKIMSPNPEVSKGAGALWWALQGIREFTRPGSGEMKNLGQARHDYAAGQAQAQYQPLLNMEKDRVGLRAGQAQADIAGENAKQEEISTGLARNPGLAAAIQNKNLTAGDAVKAQGIGMTGAAPYDLRDRNITTDARGNIIAIPKGGGPVTTEPTGIDSGPERTAPDGSKYHVNAQELNAEEQRRIAAQYAPDTTDNENVTIANNYQTKLDEWQKQEDDRQKNVGALQKQIEQQKQLVNQYGSEVGKYGSINQEETNKGLLGNGEPSLKAQQENLKLQQDALAKLRDLQGQLEKINTPSPKPTEPLLKPGKRGVKSQSKAPRPKQTITESQLHQIAKANNMTIDQVMKTPGIENYIIK